MSKAKVLLILLISCACIACQGRFPTTDDLEVLTVGESSLQFYREKPVSNPDGFYMDALGEGVLTLQDGCLRLGEDEDSSVILWPRGFAPRADGADIEVLDAEGRVVARTGTRLAIGGGAISKDLGKCRGPIWAMAP